MCGIISVIQKNKKPALKKLRKAYHSQKSRGSEGFGYITVDNGIASALIRRQTEKEIFAQLSSCRSTDILFHHRMPTSTLNTRNTAHPIPVSNDQLEYDYFVVHNGGLSNDKELSKEYKEKGFKYTSELKQGFFSEDEQLVYFEDTPTIKHNDSETVAIDVALAIEAGATGLRSRGTIAFMALQVEKTTRRAVNLFFAHNEGRPLVMKNDSDLFRVSSEGSGVAVPTHKLHVYDYATGNVSVLCDFAVGAFYCSD